MKYTTRLLLMIAFAVSSCSTALSWPVASRDLHLAREQMELVRKRFESGSRFRLGSETDVLEIKQLALKEIPKEFPQGSDPSKSKVDIEEIRWIDRDLAMLLVRSAWEERGGYDSQGYYFGGSHHTSYIVVFERFQNGWRHLSTYEWFRMSAVS